MNIFFTVYFIFIEKYKFRAVLKAMGISVTLDL